MSFHPAMPYGTERWHRSERQTLPEGPDFAFVRYLGHRLEPQVPEKDCRWVLDQVSAIEVPEAVGMLQRAMDGVFSSEPRRTRRATMSGE